MGTTRITWHGDQRYTGTDSWGNAVVPIDGDRESGNGAKPSDLLPISLAACVAYTMVQTLKKQRQAWTSMEAEIESVQQSDAPWRFEQIAVTFAFTGSVDLEKARKACNLAHRKYCAVAASLHPDVAVSYHVLLR